ncbi:hypothetical protein L596_004511 [Steinernema carpocapsae]|uniref:Uncharacterized protein n=1 Tax=Steinernema carpocapsae TaxID=34508 RepID=A0A4U8UXJ8_STECR|nr:hypothetical protein L596_004511 [Steinernema carpocapsae]
MCQFRVRTVSKPKRSTATLTRLTDRETPGDDRTCDRYPKSATSFARDQHHISSEWYSINEVRERRICLKSILTHSV